MLARGRVEVLERPSQRRELRVRDLLERSPDVLGQGDDGSAAVVVVFAAVEEAGAVEFAGEQAGRGRGETEARREIADREWAAQREGASPISPSITAG